MRERPLQAETFTVRFWGVRGTMPTPGQPTIRYGGQTSCVAMQCGDHLLIFDAGTGVYNLGETLTCEQADLFFSHTHIDHVMGFPFFGPIYKSGFTLRVHAGHLLPESGIKEALAKLMSPPLFPLTLDYPKATLSFHDFNAGESPLCPHLAQAGIHISTLPLNHPDRATGYRVDYAGRSACYITDIEHTEQKLDQALVGFVRGADLLIYDSTFDDRDFDKFKGWGHSTWQHAARIASAAGVKQLALFHHDPGMNDDKLDQRARELAAIRPGDIVARVGLEIALGAVSSAAAYGS